MKISFLGKPLIHAPKGYVRVVFIEEKGVKRGVQDEASVKDRQAVQRVRQGGQDAAGCFQ